MLRATPFIVPLLLVAFGCSVSSRPEKEATVEPSGAQGAASPQREPEIVLSEEKQRDVWDKEHATFEIETRIGKPFVKALRNADSAWVLAAFRDDCKTVNFASIDAETIQHGPLRQRRWRAAEESQSLSTAELADMLQAPWRSFSSIEHAMFRVLHIEKAGEHAWRVDVLIGADGVAEEELLQFDSRHVVEFQYERDEALGEKPTIRHWAVQSHTERRSVQALMEEVTQKMRLDQVPLQDNWKVPPAHTQQSHFQLAVEDYDRDGYLDIAVATGFGDSYLLRSSKGRHFVDVAKGIGLNPRVQRDVNFLATWIDYDNDGYPDLILGDTLYHNDKGVRFRDVTAESGLRFRPEPKGAITGDFNNDGLLDLYVLYQHDVARQDKSAQPTWIGDAQTGAANQLWSNLGDGRFRNVTRATGAGGGNRASFAAACLHLDDDPFVDLYIANDFGQNVLLRNSGDGTFEDVTQKFGVGDFATSMGVAAGDLNDDGVAELYVANMYSKMGRRIIAHVGEDDYPEGVYEGIRGACAGNRLYEWSAEAKRFVERSDSLEINAVGWSHATAMADFDSDGRLDLYSTAGYLSFDRKKPDG